MIAPLEVFVHGTSQHAVKDFQELRKGAIAISNTTGVTVGKGGCEEDTDSGFMGGKSHAVEEDLVADGIRAQQIALTDAVAGDKIVGTGKDLSCFRHA